ncbi:N-methylhydantoinase A/oxoprolinase/acetone carboxylase beta subunit [Methanohalophilus levihalophilus]|uniref:hydantoinase/oxoprolinase N-terminal domain-containing protein n=1 Tax=Methanohalophilus levihalophilus TaxID=1431282 RepID=UPI001AEAD08C|nr:hydantoinase/oxoprolinase family protein [Methanohalophilus levihalophilus]MBP2029733.1 N-methylhydantoinase A/oxoprolinase/acetone carboxylase beta subunit [Methanohalophilus levihalophilus]
MSVSLGIDAGGTYTDAVILDDEKNRVIEANKALTTYPDPLKGIKDALGGLSEQNLQKVEIVSVSTTLATNTVLEGTGFPVGLILVGDFNIQKELPTKYFVQVKGGHNTNGREAEPLDMSAVKAFVHSAKNNVSAFAVSSLFSIRNPEHEEQIRDTIRDLTGLPVVCAHHLSQDLGAFERAVTAMLNAQLIPVTEKFMRSVESEVKSRGIDASIFMLKCDGSVIGIKKALEKPIESIFSGPAGSLVGASFLSNNETCAVIDVGGTSTDVSVIYDGVPEISDDGAVVGGWKTRVKALRMETSAMGGDSHVWVKEGKIHIGPRRVIPLSRAADLYPEFLDALKVNTRPSKAILNHNIQPTSFFMKSGYEPFDLTPLETRVYEAISNEPTSLREIRRILNSYPSSKVLDSLLQKRLIQTIGFTPTDALHVLGDYTDHNVEAAQIGAEFLGIVSRKDAKEFASSVKQQFARKMASNLVSFFMNGVPEEDIRRLFDIESPIKFKVGVPVVLIGGPVVAYQKDLEEILDAEIILPEYSYVGNAAGAVAAKGIRRVDFLIRPANLATPDWEFFVFSEHGRKSFLSYHEAVDYAVSFGETTVKQYMEDAGLNSESVHINVQKNELLVEGMVNPLETKLMVLGQTSKIKG